jgi:hypothetical protein
MVGVRSGVFVDGGKLSASIMGSFAVDDTVAALSASASPSTLMSELQLLQRIVTMRFLIFRS